MMEDLALVEHVFQRFVSNYKYAKNLNVELGLIKNAIKTNNQIRAKYNKETFVKMNKILNIILKRSNNLLKPEWWNW